MRSGLIGWIRRIIASPLVIYLILVLVLLAVVLHNLSTSPAGLGPAEAATKHNSQSLSKILNKPINAPHNLLAYGLQSAGLSWNAALRFSSALLAVAIAFGFYKIARAWFGKSIGSLGSILLVTTPLFLVLARQGSAEIMLFSVAAIMAVYIRLLRVENKDFSFAGLLILGALLLYTPGIVWWLIGALVISRKKLADIMRQLKPSILTASALVSLLLLAPLGLAIAKDWTIIKQLALVPQVVGAPLEVIKRIVWMALAVFIKAPYHNDLIIGRLPILSIIQTALLVFGAYALWNAARKKLFVMATGISFAVLAAGINNNFILLALGVPAAAIIICAGLRYLYIEWRSVFPHNPLARTLAYSLMSVLVAAQLLYGIRYAIIAWPNTVGTKNTYVLK